MRVSFLIASPPSTLYIDLKNFSLLISMINPIKQRSDLKLGLSLNPCNLKTVWKYSKSMMDQY
jgi:hypothetical protein